LLDRKSHHFKVKHHVGGAVITMSDRTRQSGPSNEGLFSAGLTCSAAIKSAGYDPTSPRSWTESSIPRSSQVALSCLSRNWKNAPVALVQPERRFVMSRPRGAVPSGGWVGGGPRSVQTNGSVPMTVIFKLKYNGATMATYTY
jgi:hypothetical protein